MCTRHANQTRCNVIKVSNNSNRLQVNGDFLFDVALRLHAETIRTIMDGWPRTATSTFTQLLSSEQESSKTRP